MNRFREIDPRGSKCSFSLEIIAVLLAIVLMLCESVMLYVLFVALMRDSDTTAVSKAAGWVGLVLSGVALYSAIHLQMMTGMGVRTGAFANLVSGYITAIGSIASCFLYHGDGRWFLRSAAAIGCFFVYLAQSMVSSGAM